MNNYLNQIEHDFIKASYFCYIYKDSSLEFMSFIVMNLCNLKDSSN